MPCSKLTNILQGQENVSDLSYSTGERGGGGGGGIAAGSLLRPRTTCGHLHRAYARHKKQARLLLFGSM